MLTNARSSRKRSNDDDNDHGRHSRRLSDAADDSFTTPAVRSSCIARNAFKFCAEINGLDAAHRCDGCQRCVGTTRKSSKPRDQITTKTLQCTEMWKCKKEDVPPALIHHCERVQEAIRNCECIEPMALITAVENDNNINVNVDTNNNNNAIPMPSPPQPSRKANHWMQEISCEGEKIWIKLPTTHKVALKSDLSRWEGEMKILANVRKKTQCVSHCTNICGQTIWAIALASVPALGVSAAQCFIALVFHAMMVDTGLFNFKSKRKPFNLQTFAQSFPSKGCLRKSMQNQAARDLAPVGQRLQQKALHVHLACDKGKKKGISHFVKHLCWFDFDQMKVVKQLTDMDASDGTSEDCAHAVEHSILKLGDLLLSGQATDSGGGGVLEGLARKLEMLNMCTPDCVIAACSIHALQLQLSNAAKRMLGEGGLGKRNAMQMLHSICDLQESLDIEEWRHALIRATDCCLTFDDGTADDKHFAVAHKKMKEFTTWKCILLIGTTNSKVLCCRRFKLRCLQDGGLWELAQAVCSGVVSRHCECVKCSLIGTSRMPSRMRLLLVCVL